MSKDKLSSKNLPTTESNREPDWTAHSVTHCIICCERKAKCWQSAYQGQGFSYLGKNVYRVGKSDLKQGTSGSSLASRTDDIDWIQKFSELVHAFQEVLFKNTLNFVLSVILKTYSRVEKYFWSYFMYDRYVKYIHVI